MENNSFYSPSGNVKGSNRTYVPDIYRQVVAEMHEEELESKCDSSMSVRAVKLQSRPIVGVLYSISAGIDGELFPIYIGRNSIGSDLSCDICLRETSVSEQHGVLLARKQMNEDGEECVTLILSDNSSRYGTSVNGESIFSERTVCANGDIIAIGQNYLLAVALFGSLDKLRVAYGFDRIPEPITANNAAEVPQVSQSDESEPLNVPGGSATNITTDHSANDATDFYKPTKQQSQDHYNNKTIIL
ncbi:MAG: FHA domain-containing protein [Muribaculaceae bacterium]